MSDNKIKVFTLILLFVISLFINFLFLDWNMVLNKPTDPTSLSPTFLKNRFQKTDPCVFSPENFSYFRKDSSDYLSVANDISNFSAPETLNRTPVYPLFLSFFNDSNIKNVAFVQSILGALIPVFVFLIISVFIKNKKLSFLISVLMALDYQVISYHSIILAESLSMLFVLILLYLHILHLNRLSSRNFLVLLLLFDALLIFLKPIFVILPLMLYIVKILYILADSGKADFFKKSIFLIVGIFVNILLIFSYMGINYYRYDNFLFSDISRINMLAKNIQHGYTKPENLQKKIPPPYLSRDILKEYNQSRDIGVRSDVNPYSINSYFEVVIDGYDLKKLKEINSYFLKNNYFDYIKKSFPLIIDNITRDRNYFAQPVEKIKTSPYYCSLDKFFTVVNNLRLPGLLFVILLLYYFFTTNQRKKFFTLSMLLLSAFLVLFMSSFFSYSVSAGVRLRAPIETLMSLFVFLPFLVLINSFLENKNKNYG